MIEVAELNVRILDLMRLDGDVDQALVSLRSFDEGPIEVMLDDVLLNLAQPGVDAKVATPMIALAARWREECVTAAGARQLARQEKDVRAFLASALCVPGFATPRGTQPLLYDGEGLLLYLAAVAPRVGRLLGGAGKGGTERLFHGHAQLLLPHELALVRADLRTTPAPRPGDFPQVPGPSPVGGPDWETPPSFRSRHREVPDPVRLRVPGGDVAVFSIAGLAAALENLRAMAERAIDHGSLRLVVERTEPEPLANLLG